MKEKSEHLNELAAALAKAQGEFPDIPKDRTAEIKSPKGNYSYQYADLATIIKATRPALSKNGLAVTQLVSEVQSSSETTLGSVETTLLHSSGQFLSTSFLFGISDRMQEIGSAITYVRRYCLSGILGISTEEDDDGANGPQEKKPFIQPTSAAAPVKPKNSVSVPVQPKLAPVNPVTVGPKWTPNETHTKEIQELCTKHGKTADQLKAYMQAKFNTIRLSDLEIDQYNALKAKIVGVSPQAPTTTASPLPPEQMFENFKG